MDDPNDTNPLGASGSAPRNVPAGFEGIERAESVEFDAPSVEAPRTLDGLEGFGSVVAPDDDAVPSLLQGFETHGSFESVAPTDVPLPEPEIPALELVDLEVPDTPKPSAPTVAVPAMSASQITPATPEPVAHEEPTRVETKPIAPPKPVVANGPKCANCGRALGETYFTVDGNSVCATCKNRVEGTIARISSWRGLLGKPLLFGLGGAAIGGAAYYGLVAITNFQVGIVAILCGYFVARALLKATGGGSRKLQILAGLLTWYSVGLAYSPFAMHDHLEYVALRKASADSAATVARERDSLSIAKQLAGTDSVLNGAAPSVAQAGLPNDSAAAPGSVTPTATPSTAAAADTSEATRATAAMTRYRSGPGEKLVALLWALVQAIWLPALAMIRSGWWGLATLVILAAGIRAAVRMTKGRLPAISGPHRLTPTA